jgi:methionyl aminopeptidase
LSKEAQSALREAGRIASAARKAGASLIVAGARVRNVCMAVEDDIRRRGGALAFPAQCSRNEVAAHDCPSPDDDRVFGEGDLAKLDLGVHIDGWVVDTAVTVNVGDRPENLPLVDGARAALEAAIAQAGPGVAITRLSEAIAATLRTYKVKPIRNLCGHHVGRWTVHAPPPVPNVPDGAADRLVIGAVLAIEPFATDGGGVAAERGNAEVFRVAPGQEDGVPVDPGLAQCLRDLRGLPFSRRDLSAFPRPLVEESLTFLAACGRLSAYPPLVETTGGRVAQAEHSLLVGPNGVEVLTR